MEPNQDVNKGHCSNSSICASQAIIYWSEGLSSNLDAFSQMVVVPGWRLKRGSMLSQSRNGQLQPSRLRYKIVTKLSHSSELAKVCSVILLYGMSQIRFLYLTCLDPKTISISFGYGTPQPSFTRSSTLRLGYLATHLYKFHLVLVLQDIDSKTEQWKSGLSFCFGSFSKLRPWLRSSVAQIQILDAA